MRVHGCRPPVQSMRTNIVNIDCASATKLLVSQKSANLSYHTGVAHTRVELWVLCWEDQGLSQQSFGVVQSCTGRAKGGGGGVQHCVKAVWLGTGCTHPRIQE